MRNFILAAIVIVVISRVAFSGPSSAPTSTPTVGWLDGQISALWLKIKKIEALVTLMQEKQDAKIVSEPLREHHFPIQQVSQITVPGLDVPGMEPAKEPVPSQPVARGHYETQRFGFRGRYSRQVWVSDQPQQTYQYNYSSGGCSNGSCSGRGGIF